MLTWHELAGPYLCSQGLRHRQAGGLWGQGEEEEEVGIQPHPHGQAAGPSVAAALASPSPAAAAAAGAGLATAHDAPLLLPVAAAAAAAGHGHDGLPAHPPLLPAPEAAPWELTAVAAAARPGNPSLRQQVVVTASQLASPGAHQPQPHRQVPLAGLTLLAKEPWRVPQQPLLLLARLLGLLPRPELAPLQLRLPQ